MIFCKFGGAVQLSSESNMGRHIGNCWLSPQGDWRGGQQASPDRLGSLLADTAEVCADGRLTPRAQFDITEINILTRINKFDLIH
jgi:hypothetical protein